MFYHLLLNMTHEKLQFLIFTVAHVSVSPSTAAGVMQAPNISLTSPDRLVWVSEHVEVTRGYNCVFTCSDIPDNLEGHFIFKFSGLYLSKNYTNQSNTLSFVADYEHEGNYSCVYEVTPGKNRSAESKRINVIIKYSLLNILIYSVVPGVVLLLLMVVLVVFLVCRRRRRDSQSDSVILNQITIRNSYEEEEEEEGDYVNVNPEDTNTNPAVEAMGEDENDHDYEDPEIEDQCIVSLRAPVTVEDQEKEDSDEEENSCDENDYVNLADSVSEQTLDIYGEQQDIYQNI
ncbi:uncharacterized protein LOC112450911 [Kryptolebias marmoratus]|uniref:uncharacterized protein LOC112450911 n=1 Tax=Kryptolebias marmoratus TaxID=37003 RepID=UPI0018ACC228|nr:uncharacterized protein LOC112450911 [Kryptolebias marmoratus]